MSKMISITNDGHMIASEPLDAIDAVNITISGLNAMFQSIVDQVPEEEQQACKEELYDIFNQGASAFLSHWIPDKQLRPDLTEEAILEMENNLLEKKAKKSHGLKLVKE